MVDSTILASQQKRPLIYVVLPIPPVVHGVRARNPHFFFFLPTVRSLFVHMLYYHPRSGDSGHRSQLMISIFEKINRSIGSLT